MRKVKTFHRGFSRYEFADLYGVASSLQKSSLATEDAIWLGVDEVDGKPARMHLTRKQVKDLLPILTKFVKTGEIG